MNRTKCVASVAWSVFLVGTVAVAGCCSTPSCAPLPVTDAGPLDAFVSRDVGRDARDTNDLVPEPVPCNASGNVGAHCRAGVCAGHPTCYQLGAPTTVQSAFGIRQAGADDPDHPGYRLTQDPPNASESAPFNGLSGGLCAEECDTRAPDTCGACASCSARLTQMPLIAALGGALTVLSTTSRSFGERTGLCRIDCAWSATTRGDTCPSDMTCDAFDGVCIEQCTSDQECNTNAAYTYAGELVTVLDTLAPLTCNRSTGRCQSAGHAGAAVGDRCASASDCAPGTGVCLAGGRCAEFGCPSPGTATSVCAGGRGICLAANSTPRAQSLCLLGCNGAADCGAGNACSRLWLDAAHTMPFSIGAFTGYCIGTCASDDECAATEVCSDVTRVDAAGLPTVAPGRCVPRCTSVGGVGAASGGCAATEMCSPDHAGAAYGHCAPVDHFCGSADMRSLAASDPECATGWVCDELLAGVAGQHESIGDGHCAPACVSDGDCTGRGTCVTTGPLAGLCRVACTSAADCSAPSVCDTALGWCVEAAPPAGP